MKIIKGDIFNGQWSALFHCCNTQCTWGAGFAPQLKKRFPSAFGADLKTNYMGEDKLSLYTFADCGGKRIYNLYAQVGIGNDGNPLNRNLQYDYLFDSMFRMLHHYKETCPSQSVRIVASPLVGGGLASGNREIILTIMQEVFKLYPQFEHHLYEL